MSIDQFVQLPSGVLNASQKYEAINLLAAAAYFALPGAHVGNTTERDLEARFSGVQAIGLPDAAGWLTEQGVTLATLAGPIAPDDANGAEALHMTLQQGNDSQQMQLLAVADASKLVGMEDLGDGQLTPRALWSKPDNCLLLRVGYSTDQPYAYYAASLPGDSRRAVKITWPSIILAGVTGAIAISPAPKPVDMDRVTASLHIMQQALATAHQAHADALEALGLSPASATPAQPAPAPAG